jgi:flagellar hook-length control protein FliK
MIDGTKSTGNTIAAGPAGATSAAAAATNAATKSAAALDALGGRPAMEAKIEPGLAAKSVEAAAEASAEVAAHAAAAHVAAAAATPKAPAPTAPLQSNRALTPDSATTPAAAMMADPPAGTASAPAIPTLPAASAEKATLAAAAASAAADKVSAGPHPVALRPVAKAMGRAAPVTDSGKAPANGAEADSTVSPASVSSGDPSPANDAAKVPVPTGNAAQDASVTAAAAAAAVAGTPQPAVTGKARGDNSYDSDASLSALGAGAEAAAAASAPPGPSGMRPLIDPTVADAPMAADTGKHAHAGFDLAALTGGAADAAAGLSQLNANASLGTVADAAPAPVLRVHASVDSTDFPQGLSDRVSWMVDNGVNGAKLQVNPPQLGPIELRISVQGDHAQVWMVTHSAVARDALESSSPKLREMLNAQGFGQVSVDISQRSFQDRSAYTPHYQRESAGVRSAAVTPAAAASAASAPRSLLGALDAYA